MIAKSDEIYFENCLKEIHDLVDEIIIVFDKESEAAELAKKYGAQVFFSPVADSFSEIRNESLKHATKDWILILDADEIITKEDMTRLKSSLSEEHPAYILVQWTYCNREGDANWVPVDNIFSKQGGFRGCLLTPIIRVFRNGLGIKFSRNVHEGIEDSVKELGIEAKTLFLDVPIHHFKHFKGEAAARESELRFLGMLKNDIEKNPENFKAFSDIGIIYQKILKNPGEAVKYFERSLSINPEYQVPYFNLSSIHFERKEYAKAIGMLKKLLKMDPKNHIACANLGIIYMKIGEYDEARRSFRKAAERGADPNMVTRMLYELSQAKKAGK
jgi:tetratricopeptide (TPR) repeat protein